MLIEKKLLMARPQKVFDWSREKEIMSIMERGGSLINIAAALDIHTETLNAMRERDPTFSEFIKKGLVKSEDWWQNKGKNLGSQELNATLWYMNMKNRFQWHDHKPTYPLKKLEGFDGDLLEKSAAIDKALKKGKISTDEHNMLQNSLLCEAKIYETHVLVKRIEMLENAAGITQTPVSPKNI